MTTKLTKIETEALLGIYNSDYRDGDSPVDHQVWTWSANPFDSKRTFSGAVSSLVKKGLAGICGDRGDEATVWMTQAGWDALKEALPERRAEFDELDAVIAGWWKAQSN